MTTGEKPSWAVFGRKIRCIRSDLAVEPLNGERLPRLGEVYTVRDVFARKVYKNQDYWFITLKEIKNPLIRRWTYSGPKVELVFYEKFFEPVWKQELDIGVFRSLLTKSLWPGERHGL